MLFTEHSFFIIIYYYFVIIYMGLTPFTAINNCNIIEST